MTPISCPAPRNSPIVACNVRTTPLTCGSHASVTINILMRRPAERAWSGRSAPRPPRPSGGFHASVMMFDQRGAAFDPVAVVIIFGAVDFAHLGTVDRKSVV